MSAYLREDLLRLATFGPQVNAVSAGQYLYLRTKGSVHYQAGTLFTGLCRLTRGHARCRNLLTAF